MGKSLFDLSWQTIFRRLVLLGLLILFPFVWLVMTLATTLSGSRKSSLEIKSGARWAPVLGILLAVFSVAWLGVQVYEVGATLLSFGYGSYSFAQLLVGVDRQYAWIYFFPIAIALVSIGMLLFAVLSWKHSYWGKARRFYYSFTAGVALVYSLFLATAGQLTVFFSDMIL